MPEPRRSELRPEERPKQLQGPRLGPPAEPRTTRKTRRRAWRYLQIMAESRSATSRRMAAVRQGGTAPELRVREALRKLGVRYRANVRSLPGTPDLVNVRRGFAILVHGCFWHRHPSCAKATMPKLRRPFWLKKFQANVRRDSQAQKALEARGLRVIVIWECETREPRLLELVKRRLRPALVSRS